MAWQPLESNPEVMNKFLHFIGVPETWEVTDVYGLDPDLLAMVPKPVLAVILLFPCSEMYEKHKEEEAAKLAEEPQQISNKVIYMKQTIHNACGTIALLHSIANSEEQIGLQDGELKSFLEKARPLSPASRGRLLEDTMDLATVHHGIAQEGQTEESPGSECWRARPRDASSPSSGAPPSGAPPKCVPPGGVADPRREPRRSRPVEVPQDTSAAATSSNSDERSADDGSDPKAPPADANIIHHFVAFVHKDGVLYELDGRKTGPISHGPTTQETLLEDAAVVCKKFMERDPDDLRFTVMALTAAAS